LKHSALNSVPENLTPTANFNYYEHHIEKGFQSLEVKKDLTVTAIAC